ncbi:hypothetical protein PTKIN_Ptkin07bG0023100 [Pterospermum kingtungense]
MVIGIGCNTAAFLTTLLIISSSLFLVNAVDIDYPSVAYPPNQWVVPVNGSSFWNSAGVRPILITGKFVCGFHCQDPDPYCLFGISIVQTNNTFDGNSTSSLSPKIVWSVNQIYLVPERDALELSEEGGLMLNNYYYGYPVCNTSSAGNSVSRVKLTEEGNLVLYGRNNEIVWQSFHHPTDTLLPGQSLVSGRNLTSSYSGAAFYSLALIKGSLIVFLEPDTQQVYFELKTGHRLEYINGRFGPFVLPSTSESQFIQLGSDGQLRVYQWSRLERKWKQVSDLLIRHRPSKRRIIAILGSTIGATLFILFVVVGVFFLHINKNHLKYDKEDNQKLESFGFTRFSYHTLGAMTENFSVKIGEGGFGSVFFGSLPNSTKIAVKHLDDSVHVKKSFLAEVETLGSVHHINLVTLIGFCVEKSHRLLVYEYLHNGSLDRWIFSRNPECNLGWKLRQKIIYDVAKGLAYLHDECHQKILHLDVKPQNILLDQNFRARIADFGLSKLIDRNQNQIITAMRGTPGYMAPEWSSATITEKADVYSFGIVVLEILCGRRNVDRSQPEEEMHLLRLFMKKAGEGKLLELVDKFNEDMQSNGEEVVEMMRMVAWCLQADYNMRPSMWAVVKVLEGNLNVEDNLSYDFLNMQAARAIATPSRRAGTTSVPLPSILSGPR